MASRVQAGACDSHPKLLDLDWGPIQSDKIIRNLMVKNQGKNVFKFIFLSVSLIFDRNSAIALLPASGSLSENHYLFRVVDELPVNCSIQNFQNEIFLLLLKI